MSRSFRAQASLPVGLGHLLAHALLDQEACAFTGLRHDCLTEFALGRAGVSEDVIVAALVSQGWPTRLADRQRRHAARINGLPPAWQRRADRRRARRILDRLDRAGRFDEAVYPRPSGW